MNARRTAVASSVLATAVLAMSTGCSNADEDARQQAVDQVRTSAHGARAAVQQIATAPDAPTGEPLLQLTEQWLATSPDVIVFDRRVTDNDGIALRVALHRRGEAGGGGTYTATVARLCVEISATPGSDTTISDTPCPATLPTHTSLGTVDITTTLTN